MKTRKFRIVLAAGLMALALCCAFFFSTSMYVNAKLKSDARNIDKLLSMQDIEKMGDALRIAQDSGSDVVIAYVNDIPIFHSEVQVHKVVYNLAYNFHQEFEDGILPPKSDKDFLDDIAMMKLSGRMLEEKGIQITKEQAIEKVREREQRRRQDAADGDELSVQTLENNERFYAALNTTEDEFIEGYGSDYELRMMISSTYRSLFHKDEFEKLQKDPAYQMRNYSDHMNELLEKSDLRIVNSRFQEN